MTKNPNSHLYISFILFIIIFVRPSYSEEINLERANALSQQVMELYDQDKYAEAIPIAEMALEIKEKALGPGHIEVALCLNHLGVLYKSLGNYAKAEQLYKRALEINVAALGPNHSRVGLIKNNLASLYNSLGDYSKAEHLYKQTLEIFEKVLGPDHPRVAKALYNFGMLYSSQGDYGKAESTLNRALIVSGKAFGPEHPVVSKILNELISIDKIVGDNARAEPRPNKKPEIDVPALDKKDVAGPSNDAVNKKLKPTSPKSSSTEKTPSYPYTLQLGSFRTLRQAERAKKIYSKKGLSPYWTKVELEERGVWYIVFTGYFAGRKDAKIFRKEHRLKRSVVKKTPFANLINIHTSGVELEAETKKLKELGYSPYHIEYPDGKILLYVGSFLTREGAEEQYHELKSRGIENQITER